MNTTKVLIVEDDEDTRSLIVELLISEGYSAEGVGDGTEALPLFTEKELPSLIFLDVSIPGITSKELMVALNARPDRNKVKVLLASGWDDLQVRCKEMGADGFIRKPLDIDKILSIVSEV